eukprot:1160842-Pelagomonas_calceolata.AAC.7
MGRRVHLACDCFFPGITFLSAGLKKGNHGHKNAEARVLCLLDLFFTRLTCTDISPLLLLLRCSTDVPKNWPSKLASKHRLWLFTSSGRFSGASAAPFQPCNLKWGGAMRVRSNAQNASCSGLDGIASRKGWRTRMPCSGGQSSPRLVLMLPHEDWQHTCRCVGMCRESKVKKHLK